MQFGIDVRRYHVGYLGTVCIGWYAGEMKTTSSGLGELADSPFRVFFLDISWVVPRQYKGITVPVVNEAKMNTAVVALNVVTDREKKLALCGSTYLSRKPNHAVLYFGGLKRICDVENLATRQTHVISRRGYKTRAQ